MLHLACERVLVDRSAARAEDEEGNAVALGERLQRVVVACDDVVDSMPDEHRLDALVPPRRLVVPQRAVEQKDHRLSPHREALERAVEPRELRVGEAGLDLSVAVLGVEDDEARELELDRVVERSEARAVVVCEGAVLRIALAADEVVVAGGRVEGDLEPRHDAEEVVVLALHHVVVARVALHEVANAEHGVRPLAVEVVDRFGEVAEAPVAAGRAVRDQCNQLPSRRGRLHDVLAVDGLAGGSAGKRRWREQPRGALEGLADGAGRQEGSNRRKSENRGRHGVRVARAALPAPHGRFSPVDPREAAVRIARRGKSARSGRGRRRKTKAAPADCRIDD